MAAAAEGKLEEVFGSGTAAVVSPVKQLDYEDQSAFINNGEIAALDTPENLKLRHGTRSVTVRVRDGDDVREEHLPLDGADTRLAELATSPDLLTMHTEEATLEHIFIQLTGRGLEG